MAANRVLLWRHGQTDWNVVNRFQGHSDIDLNEVGRFQVQHAAQILAGMKPTMIISSDLGRARDTAQSLARLWQSAHRKMRVARKPRGLIG